MLANEKKKIAEEVNLSFASMVKGYPFTTFSKKQSNRFLLFRNFWVNPNPFYLQKKDPLERFKKSKRGFYSVTFKTQIRPIEPR